MKLILYLLCLASAMLAQAEPPVLKKNANNATQLIVHGKPFLMLAGEAGNSSVSHIQYMDETMKSLREANWNSLLVSVSWERIEPKEGFFDFTSVDKLIGLARKHDLKLGLLWFGSWKNGLSPYAPAWVLEDTKRFARVKDEKGQITRILTPLCEENRKADAKAFHYLMKHIASIDGRKNTVLVVQVENEVGVHSQTRDFSEEANRAYASKVPRNLIQYMVKNKDNLEIELKTAWEQNGSKTNGTWTEVFGQGDDTDLFFMAWHYSRYLNAVAQSGKQAYNIPMYANCWMSLPRPNPGKPGKYYLSGGPVLAVLDIWKAGAPFIDILAPDAYRRDFKDEANFFHRPDNPLFIPETVPTRGAGTYAFAEHDAICFSPFGINNKGSATAREYAMLKQLMPVITKYQGSHKMAGLYKVSGDQETGRDFQLNGDTKITVRYSLDTGIGPPPSTNATDTVTQRNQEQPSYGIFIQTGENEFIVAGLNISVSASSTNPRKEVWLKDAWEGTYENGEWKPRELHNGDEAGFLRSNDPTYFIRGAGASEAAIFHFKVLAYDR